MDEIFLKENELSRYVIIEQVRSGLLNQIEAGQALGLSDRQVRRLVKRVGEEGAPGIRSKHIGGNRQFCPILKEKILSKFLDDYKGFGPTFASEKFLEREGISVSKETLRKWLVEAGLRKARSRKDNKIHQRRERRPRFGELVQIDGSYHEWFEKRGGKCCLLVFIDDATGKLLQLYFCKTETTLNYMHLMKEHIKEHGRPIAYYSDKHGIFKVTKDRVDGLLSDTQLTRALNTLNIEIICAHSPQAKGRVERSNQTLQDRLIKEMRLRGISTVEQANKYAPEFIKFFNAKFGVVPENAEDAHRPCVDDVQLDRILSIHRQRKVTKDLEFSFENQVFQIINQGKGYRIQKQRVTIYEHTDGRYEVFHDTVGLLSYKILKEMPKQNIVIDAKEINIILDQMVAKVKTQEVMPIQKQAYG